jgi:hypothetical protein
MGEPMSETAQDTTEAVYAAGVDRTGRWWVTAPDGATAYRFGGGPQGSESARAAAQRANDGGAIGVPPWPSAPPEVRPGNESVDVPMRGSDMLDGDTFEGTTRTAADGWDEQLWQRRGF